jgi:hypothetical protein
MRTYRICTKTHRLHTLLRFGNLSGKLSAKCVKGDWSVWFSFGCFCFLFSNSFVNNICTHFLLITQVALRATQRRFENLSEKMRKMVCMS